MTEPQFPVKSFNEAYEHLRRPFVPEAVGFKLQATGGKDRGWGVVIAYIDARNVTARLNMVCGGLWHETYEAAGEGLVCHLTVDGVTHTDWGVTTGTSKEMSIKGTYSDALKRAAVRFGVGESLYATPSMRLYDGPHLETWMKGDKRTGRLTPAGELHCRQIYAEWLDRTGRQAFGEPLDHGDSGKQTDAQVLADLMKGAGLKEAEVTAVREWAVNGDGLDPARVTKAIKLIEADEVGLLAEVVNRA